MRQASPARDALENVVYKGVHDTHGLDAGVRVDLLQHLVHVDRVALLCDGAALLCRPFLSLGHAFWSPSSGPEQI